MECRGGAERRSKEGEGGERRDRKWVEERRNARVNCAVLVSSVLRKRAATN